ncbi:vomeronasal type-2 receptor 116-like [Microtus oregoni]|uniref:vomeronasal type-2 receptor 116-like n=1 Tax=Microtus oregoni TaxID=111838 RepID=UPI001BB1748C|nr:vomeronasal type-2 receptor 116-like [Microtus oregoni]
MGAKKKMRGTHGAPEVTIEYPWTPEEGIGYSGLVMEKVDYWEVNLDPLEKVLIATEPYLQLLNRDFKKIQGSNPAIVELTGNHGFHKIPLETRTPKKNFQFVLAFMFSLDEVIRDPDLLPNMSFQFETMPSSCKIVPQLHRCLEHSINSHDITPNYNCINLKTCVVMISGPSWVVSSLVAKAMDSNIPPQILQLTFGPFHPILSDREQFPFLYQMALEDTSLPLAMVSLILHFSWNWVGLTISDHDQGIHFFSYLRTEMEKSMLCFAFVNMILINMHMYMSRAEVYYNQILTSSSNVVIIYGETDSTLSFSFRMWTSRGIQRIWVTTSQFDVTTSKSDFLPELFHGTLAFAYHHAEISGFKNFIQTVNPLKYSDEYLAGLEWMNFNCGISASMCKTLRNCSSNSSLEWLIAQTFDMAFSDDSYDIYNAVYTMAHVYHEMLLQPMGNQEVHLPNCLKLALEELFSLMKPY